ncbi:MAG: M2 family metallopeptidase [Candidatus Riflebacteria bacterium]|nr:M2 family metallopeptidase [Candidatus Riflebacteria bacterium]
MAPLGIPAVTTTTPSAAPANDDRARSFIESHETRVRPLEKAASLAWWSANVTGNDEDFKAKEEAQNQLDLALSDSGRFAGLKAIRDATVRDPLLARQVDVLYLQYMEKQVNPELLRKMTARSNAIEQAFNVFRASVDGQELPDSAVRRVLKQSKSSTERKKAWEASKEVGARVFPDLVALVKLRNEAARTLGFGDYHVMQLQLAEQSQVDVLKLFDEMDELTRAPFDAVKTEIDVRLASDCGITVEELRPWHYHDPFFQEAPALFAVDLDAAFSGADIPGACRTFYAGIGLPIDDVLRRSDLYEKSGKSPHAFCTDIDREGDVRVLANIVPNARWMRTMLHELEHAIYSSKFIPREVPYVLRTESHILTTEAMAMTMEKLCRSSGWLARAGIRVADPQGFDRSSARLGAQELLIFSRWCQVKLRFERAMYADPDQDLNTLWWDLVEKYQQLRRPERRDAPDFASKIHIVSAPAYYHNYAMGQMFASQLTHTIARQVLGTEPGKALFADNEAIGEFLRNRFFAPGKTMRWNALIEHVTGEALNARAFALDFEMT